MNRATGDPEMPYTTQGFMTAADVAEVRRDMDLDLCGCCEDGTGSDPDETGTCQVCDHDADDHA